MPDRGLGRRIAQDTRHLERYPLRSVQPQTVATVERFLPLPYQYRSKMDQGSEGSCVGWAASWMMSILNRRFYDAVWLYKEAKKVDGWEGEDYSGTSVRAGMDVLRTVGHRLLDRHTHEHHPDPAHGILENRWAVSVDEIRTCIANGVPVVIGVDWMSAFDSPVKQGRDYWIGQGELGHVRGGHAICVYAASDRRQAVKLTNSWGISYPLTWLPYDTLQRLLDGIQYPGEATVVVDR